MALARPLPPLWQTLLPGLTGPVRPLPAIPSLQRLSRPFATPFGALAIPSLSLPALPSLADIWNGILNAVPKKKTSYRKKRQRFMAGKGLKDITSLNKCSGCGRVKRMHVLCPYCVDAIKSTIFGQLNWSIRRPTEKQAKQLKREKILESRRTRIVVADPRKEAEDQVLKHTGWKK
ncbi:hypothetical protein ACN47E_003565 [Coniothyrium glycines]